MPSGLLRPAILFAVLALAGLVAWSAYYTVPSDSVAVVQRFGRYLKDVPSGLHFKLPLGIDVATIVPVKRQLKEEFGFATAGATDPYQISRDGKRETQMVTGDLNAALVEWVIQYRISDPVKFLFDVREPRGTLRDVSESAMREVVGDRNVDEVITIGRQEIEVEALTKMQALSTKYGEWEVGPAGGWFPAPRADHSSPFAFCSTDTWRRPSTTDASRVRTKARTHGE
jgi:membrane protease subunit HflK